MTKQEYLDSVRSAMINISNRNCNLVSLGYVINDASLTQLQFLSLLEHCFNQIEIFSDEQMINLDNILNHVLTLSVIDGQQYDTSKTISNMDVTRTVAATTDKEIAILRELCVWLSSYGGDTIKECTASCNEYNKSAIALYNMFNAALCAKAINQMKLYDTLIKYIVSKLAQVGFNIPDVEPEPNPEPNPEPEPTPDPEPSPEELPETI